MVCTSTLEGNIKQPFVWLVNIAGARGFLKDLNFQTEESARFRVVGWQILFGGSWDLVINVIYKILEAPGFTNKYKKNGWTTKGNFTVTSMHAICR